MAHQMHTLLKDARVLTGRNRNGADMTNQMSNKAAALFDAPEFVVLATIDPDGQPQLSVVWAARDGNDILISTVEGRRKHRNLVRDPRATLLLYPKANPHSYVEVRGHATMSRDGARELIDRLAQQYRGEPRYTMDDGHEVTRVVVRVVPDHVVERGL